MTAELHVGDTNPASIQATVTTTPAGIAGTAVTAASFVVQRSDGTEVTLSGTISGATSTTLVVTHLFSGSDLTVPGAYRVYVSCNVSSALYRTPTFTVPIKGKYE